jgi:radical SAM superfamily enzyme YgiQ (UPF0313 family)
MLVKENNLNGVKFYDANFFVDRKRVITFAQGLIDREIPIKWAASAHPYPMLKMSDEEMRILERSGLSRLLIGAESGNPDELKFIDKHITTEDVINVAQKCNEYNIHGSFTVIVGYPGFPKDYIGNTLRFGEMLREIDHRHEMKAHIFTPYPGTPLFMESIAQGFNPPKTIDEWSTYDYYEIETPWVNNQDMKIIREFNERNCPYVL